MSRDQVRRGATLVAILAAAAGMSLTSTATAAIAAPKAKCDLAVTTPYSADRPLRLPLVLDSTGNAYSGSAVFRSITVSDTRRSNKRWTLKALAGPLSLTPAQGTAVGGTGDGQINSQNVGISELTTLRA